MSRRAGPRGHLDDLRAALDGVERELGRVQEWGGRLADTLLAGGRLLAAGNGGSAAQAQHLTAELVGRYEGERRALSAIALHADTSALTAIGNDYGPAEAFARGVRAHGRPGDILVALSCSGESPNVLAAAAAAAEGGLETWALTGAGPNALAACADEHLCVRAQRTATVQEAHLVAVHVLCSAVDRRVEAAGAVAAAREALR